ncbi:hypothetical protein [Spartinivicinus poritis]|uniref:Uncharacterized protein n=1 Tax=Spartinivicinus poritis TaxID=2994640 RepID=A0ABT5UHK0_9GAMM|nr:hypothetical protein [Spartinivicinus sp. A2-2]MDE1465880.1 hypothetical protein [Spartinivicinus sp. A2-2]
MSFITDIFFAFILLIIGLKTVYSIIKALITGQVSNFLAKSKEKKFFDRNDEPEEYLKAVGLEVVVALACILFFLSVIIY